MIQTTLGVDGMMCSMCEAHVNDVIRKKFSVKSVKSNRRKKTCVVVSEEPLDEAVAKSALADMGYDLVSFETGPVKKRWPFG